MRTKAHSDAQMSSTWNMSAGRQTMARPTKKWAMDRPFENDASVKKDMFCAEHIFLGTTSCTNLCKLLPVESAYCKTSVENILQKYSSYTFT